MKLLRHLSGGVVIHGGRYYKTILVIIESGLLYTVALVCATVYSRASCCAHGTGIRKN